MSLLTALSVPALIAVVTLGAAVTWRREINAFLRKIERY